MKKQNDIMKLEKMAGTLKDCEKKKVGRKQIQNQKI